MREPTNDFLTLQDGEPAVPEELHGGLKGRFALDFCVLQSSLDALTCYLDTEAPLPVRETAGGMLREMGERILRLERLADNAADLGVDAVLGDGRDPIVMEMNEHLAAYAACANEELALRGLAARIEAVQSESDLWVKADASLADALLANLLSNAVAANPAARITLACTSRRAIVLRDGGPGLPPAARTLLTGGACAVSLVDRGSTGLLLVRKYAAALGWKITLPEGEGGAIELQLPEFAFDPAAMVFADSETNRAARRAWQALRLRREFAALPGANGTQTSPT